MRIGIYARYSTDLQNDKSIEDQIRVCEERAKQEGWTLAMPPYADHAISGASLIRPGIQALMLDAQQGKFDIIVAEDLDRISRDQEDTAGIYKRMQFADVQIFTLADGFISELHVGLKSTVNAIQLKQTAHKVRRAQRGLVANGKNPGGNAFGYDIVRQFDARGEPIRGDRVINDRQAKIINRIMEDYAAGQSPKAIAKQLNKEGIESPSGKGWTQSSINGNRKRGTGILNNELYIGTLVHNRCRYLKNPDTGKRVSRLNPEEEWLRKDHPDLRIVSDELWGRVKARQKKLCGSTKHLWQMNRPSYLLSGLLKCSECGGGFSMVSAKHVGCSTARNKGTCDNRRTIKREEVEHRVLGALRHHLMDEELCETFCDEYIAHANKLRIEHNASLSGYKAELTKVERECKKLAQSIIAGVDPSSLVEHSKDLASRKAKLEVLLETTVEAPTLFHPSMAQRYHEEVSQLIQSLNMEGKRAEAAELIRSLIDRIVLSPREDDKGLHIDLHGSLAGILTMATDRGRSAVEASLRQSPMFEDGSDTHDSENKVALVAGARKSRDLAKPETPLVAGKSNQRKLTHAYEKTLPKQGLHSRCQEALVAGVGFEPTTFRL